MKIEQLQQLIKIVEKGSINEAAKELYIARSSISSSMKRLEDELGGNIFERHSKGVFLTPFGADVYNQAAEIVKRVGYLEGLTKQNEIAADKLRIASMYCSMANDALAELLSSHYKEKLDAIIEETTCFNVIRFIKEGFCDIGIITLFHGTEEIFLSQMAESNIEWNEMVERKLGAIVGPKNPLYNQEIDEIELEDLIKYPHLENYATPTDRPWEQTYAQTGQYRSEYLVSDLGLALRLVYDTDAVMIDAYDNEIYNNLYRYCDYKFIPISNYPKCRTGWIRKKHAKLNNIAEEFIRLLKKRTEKAI